MRIQYARAVIYRSRQICSAPIKLNSGIKSATSNSDASWHLVPCTMRGECEAKGCLDLSWSLTSMRWIDKPSSTKQDKRFSISSMPASTATARSFMRNWYRSSTTARIVSGTVVLDISRHMRSIASKTKSGGQRRLSGIVFKSLGGIAWKTFRTNSEDAGMIIFSGMPRGRQLSPCRDLDMLNGGRTRYGDIVWRPGESIC